MNHGIGTSRYIDSSGVKIHCVEHGSGPLMVLIHGYPDFWYTWRQQMAAWSDTYRTVAMDLRGFNYSGKPHGVEHYTMEKLCGDVRSVIE